jgi:uncharacterized Zn finger protein (UPF0148 family)
VSAKCQQAELEEAEHKAREAREQERLESSPDFQAHKTLVETVARVASVEAKVDMILAELRRLSERPNGPVELRHLNTATTPGFKAFPASTFA